MPSLRANDPLPLLAPVGRPVADNQGGVQEVYLLPQAALLRDPLRRGPSIVGDVQLRPGAVWYPLRGVLDTTSFDESFTEDRAQGLHVGRLAGFVAEDTPELAAALLLYRNVRLVLLYRDRNGQLKLAGDTTSWYVLSYALATEATSAGRNGYKIELSGSTLRPALYYGGKFPLTSGSSGSGQLPVGPGVVEVYDRSGKLMVTAKVGQRITITSGFRVSLNVQ